MKELNSTRKRSMFNRPGRVALAAGIVIAGLLAGGWFVYAMPNQPSTGPVLADTGTTKTPVSTPASTPTAQPTAEPTAAPTVAPTVVPTVAPTSVPPPPRTTYTIAVPVIRQTMVLDCETAALQMGLATYGYYYSQNTLFAREHADLRPPVMGPNHTVLQWGDPYTNFVGNVDGSDWTPTAARDCPRRQSTMRSRPVTPSRYGSKPTGPAPPSGRGRHGTAERFATRTRSTR
jgi:hypothetical protein